MTTMPGKWLPRDSKYSNINIRLIFKAKSVSGARKGHGGLFIFNGENKL